jgi:hypothetical protein
VCVILCRLLGINQDASSDGAPKDIIGHWAQNYLTAAVRRGLLSGYDDGLFRPSAVISRQEMAALISKVIDVGVAAGSNKQAYTDVPSDSWSAGAIAVLSAHGIISGYPDGAFRPYTQLSRAEAVSIIDKIVDFPKKNF